MDIFKITLIIIAYTIGIVTITLQTICFKKDIEYKETLMLTTTFLGFLIAMTILEFNLINTSIIRPILFALLILLSYAIPLNMHQERIVKNVNRRNKQLLYLLIGFSLFFVVFLLLDRMQWIEIGSMAFLICSLIYSMVLTLNSEPSLLIKHREKEERKSAKMFLFGIPIFAIMGFVNEQYNIVGSSLFGSIIIVNLVFIALAQSKLSDDLKRLTMFSPKVKNFESNKNFNLLTPREKEVTQLLSQGYIYKDIADKLFISLPTVKTHVSNMYKKLHVKNKVELINLLSD